jgi:hypothetical protein
VTPLHLVFYYVITNDSSLCVRQWVLTSSHLLKNYVKGAEKLISDRLAGENNSGITFFDLKIAKCRQYRPIRKLLNMTACDIY